MTATNTVKSSIKESGDQSKGLILVDKKDDKDGDSFIKTLGNESYQRDTDNEVENNEPFIPTHDWQVIKKGQSIPAGLHVRVDMQTGVKEAKLMGGDDGSRFQAKASTKEEAESDLKRLEGENKPSDNAKLDDHRQDSPPKEDGPKIILSEEEKPVKEFNHKDDKLYFTKQHLKEALKDFRDKFENKDLKMDEEVDVTRAEAVKKKFRTIEQIRSELEDTLGVQMKSDVDIMKNKLEILEHVNSTEKEKEVALDDLEYYSHQIDNAKDLEKMGGLKLVIEFLNSSNVVLQEKAARVIGAAAQSNPKVQTAALEHNTLPLLLRLISYSSDKQVKKKALYALSALIRSHSKAQIAFLKLEGLSHLLDLLKDKSAGQLRIKVMTLISDLLVEQNDVKQRMVKSGKLKPEDSVPLMTALVSQGLCEVIPNLLESSDFDMQEKVLQAIKSSLNGCKNIFRKKKLSEDLTKLRDSFTHRINEESDKDFKSYLIDLQQQVKDVIKQLK